MSDDTIGSLLDVIDDVNTLYEDNQDRIDRIVDTVTEKLEGNSKDIDVSGDLTESVVARDDQIEVVVDTGKGDDINAVGSINFRETGDGDIIISGESEEVTFKLPDDANVGGSSVESNNGLVTITIPRDNNV